jgi:hypothetical protein
MFGIGAKLRRMVGSIKIRASGDIIKIDGLPADVINNSIKEYWESKQIGTWMFNTITSDSLSFHSFFLPDFAYVINTLILENKGQRNIRALRKLYADLFTNTWLGETVKDYPNILNLHNLNRLNITLLDKQMEFLKTYNELVPKWRLQGFALGAKPGVGKTLCCVALGECLDADVKIFIVPKNAVRSVWVDTLKTRLVKPPEVWDSLMGTLPPKGLSYYIFHYDALDKAIEFAKTARCSKPFIALDESHNFNEWTSNRTQAFIKLCQITKCQHVVWSSGTLVKAIGKEVMPLLTTIDVMFTSDVAERFKKIYGMNASRAADILRHRLGLVTFKAERADDVEKAIEREIKIKIPNGNDYTLESIRVLMSDYIKKQLAYYQANMAQFTRHYNYCLDVFEKTLKTPEQHQELKTYKRYVKQIQREYDPVLMKEQVLFCNKYELTQIVPALPNDLKNEFKNLRSIVKYYFLKVQGEALGRVFGKMRMQCNLDMVKYTKMEDVIEAAVKKTLVFTSYVEVVDETYKYLTDLGFKPLRVYGATNNDLTSILNDFKNDPDANPVIATFQSLSTAVPMIEANTEIFLNSPFRPHEREQTIARVDRRGQDTQCRIFDYFLDTGDQPNISTRSKDIMKMAEEMVDAILGGPNPHLSDHVAAESLTDYLEGANSVSLVPQYVNWT